ncbi:hypothetical protein MRBLMA1_001225 [Sphingobium sp. LMA1-1-1.1]|uniref:hypothetical protein n=1 Tax=Sphingobium sp. LMA1-1-1.1 TaxID=3135238 RepID=UPI0034482080
MTEEAKKPWVTRWGADPDSWNCYDPDDDPYSDGSGMPGRELVRGAVARWMMTQTVASVGSSLDVAMTFNLPLQLAAEAVGGLPCDLGEAVQVWSSLNHDGWGDSSVGDAALAFLLPPAEIVAAVEHHPWMYLTGDRADIAGMLIGHEGE